MKARLAKLLRSSLGQARLLARDPEAFFRNLRQYTAPADYLARLLDTPAIRPLPIEQNSTSPPALNILLPSIGPVAMTGGPNTVLHIGCAIAQAGIPVRFVSSDTPLEGGEAWFWRHVQQLTGHDRLPTVTIADTTAPLRIGAEDLFMASFWTTAHQANAALAHTRAKSFLYLIQDFEPGFYPWSSRYALAAETYAMPFHPIINEAFLADHLAQSAIGRFADPQFRTAATVFEPAVDRTVFNPGPPQPPRTTRRLLVYARPTNPRNLLGIALEALKSAIAGGGFPGDWQFQMIGARGSLPPIDLGHGHRLTDAPWADYQGYARLLQASDILLCPMLSPHTSYPVLEMAACGGLAVTNSFGAKTAARLQALSANILAADPTTPALATALATAAQRIAAAAPHPGHLRTGDIAMPATWNESLAGIAEAVAARMRPAA